MNQGFRLLVIPERFELSTHSLEGCCSIQLSYGTIGIFYECKRKGSEKIIINNPQALFSLIDGVFALSMKNRYIAWRNMTVR